MILKGLFALLLLQIIALRSASSVHLTDKRIEVDFDGLKRVKNQDYINNRESRIERTRRMAELLSKEASQDEEMTDELIAIQSTFRREMTDLFSGIDCEALSKDQKMELNALLAENMAEIARSSLSDMSTEKQEEIKEHLMFKIRSLSVFDLATELEGAVEETCADVAKIPLSKMDFDVLRILINEDHLDNLTVRAQRMKRMLEINAKPLPSQEEEQEYLAIQAEFEREMTELLEAAGVDVDALPEDQKFELNHSIIAKNMAQIAFLAACIN